jgi:hypothetical protein
MAKTRDLKTSSPVSPLALTRVTQSSVFLRSGVTEELYSGLAMNTPGYSPSRALKARALSGGPSFASRSPL